MSPVTLASLPDHIDTVVRIGGRVERVDGRRVVVDDGTAQVAARLAAEVEPIEPVLRVGEVLNITGRVRVRSSGRLEVVVRSAADVRRAARLEEATSLTSGEVSTVPLAAALQPPPVAVSGELPLVPLLVAIILGHLRAITAGDGRSAGVETANR